MYIDLSIYITWEHIRDSFYPRRYCSAKRQGLEGLDKENIKGPYSSEGTKMEIYYMVRAMEEKHYTSPPLATSSKLGDHHKLFLPPFWCSAPPHESMHLLSPTYRINFENFFFFSSGDRHFGI